MITTPAAGTALASLPLLSVQCAVFETVRIWIFFILLLPVINVLSGHRGYALKLNVNSLKIGKRLSLLSVNIPLLLSNAILF